MQIVEIDPQRSNRRTHQVQIVEFSQSGRSTLAIISSVLKARIGSEVLEPLSGRRVSDIHDRSMACARSPNKSPEPTLGAAVVFGNPEVFHTAAGVAHL
jgi:hypothetical protein